MKKQLCQNLCLAIVLLASLLNPNGILAAQNQDNPWAQSIFFENDLFNGTALITERAFGVPIRDGSIEEVVITNTLPVPDEAADLPNLTVLSIASILADALKAIFTDDSVSEIFMGENA